MDFSQYDEPISERREWKRTSRLVETDDVRAAPGGSAENDLDLLTARETAHGVVRDEFGVETEVSEVLFDLATDERTEETEALSLTGVNLENFLRNEGNVISDG